MSDSDDTDLLLLIPPDYFITSAQEKLQQEESINKRNRHLQRQLDATEKCCMLFNKHKQMSAGDEQTAPPSAAYKFLPPNKKAELNFINARLQSIESIQEKDINNAADRFAAPSDISTISACTVRSRPVRNGVVHSTPKSRLLRDDAADVGVLSEIDHFLEDRQYPNSDWSCQSEEYHGHNAEIGPFTSEAQVVSLPTTSHRHCVESSPHVHFDPNVQQLPSASTTDNNLISLSELWSKSGQNTAIVAGTACSTASMSLKEEQLRRQHLEKSVHILQTKLLEYEQRISVAIEVDKQKDIALKNTQWECRNLESDVLKMRCIVGKLEQDQRDFNSQRDTLQRELAQAVSLATKFQEKNEKLETEINASARKANEYSTMCKVQLEELEAKVHGSKRSEEFALNELSNLKDKLLKVDYQNEKLKMRCDDLEKENSALKHQKEMLQEFHHKLKARADGLEAQKKSFQDSISQLTESEISLKKRLESQQKSLKMHYQQQLENVVAQKLREFQAQLDKTEEVLKSEARERERLIADRAVKQLELINEKNELEHNLLQEKHNEEVELYRIQLANASKKIDDLESKLITYKSKRADIAEKLHCVMETQWQKALEILTSPSNQLKSVESNIGTDVEISPEANDGFNNGQAHTETPKTSKNRKASSKQNNLNVGNDVEPTASSQKTAEPEPVDRLQAYIELLLSKSPSDVDKVNEILSLTKNARTINGKLDKHTRRNFNSHTKPPWKA